eukprot:EG_transcript_36165
MTTEVMRPRLLEVPTRRSTLPPLTGDPLAPLAGALFRKPLQALKPLPGLDGHGVLAPAAAAPRPPPLPAAPPTHGGVEEGGPLPARIRVTQTGPQPKSILVRRMSEDLWNGMGDVLQGRHRRSRKSVRIDTEPVEYEIC